MLNKVADFIAKHRLMSREGLHLVALRGGADSVAMLLILKDEGEDAAFWYVRRRLKEEKW